MGFDFRNNQNSQNGSMPPPPGAGSPFQAQTPQQAQDAGILSMLIDYNKKFMSAPPAKHRDGEVFQVISQLMMSQKCCSLLVGAPGVGKTRIVEEIGRLIANQSPYTSALNAYTLYELPIANLMAGTQYRGDLEQKVKELVEWAEKNKVILFIDEIHQLTSGRKGYDGVAQMLKPAMARGSIKIIGATTLQESKELMDDPAFSRRFNKVQVCELSMEQTVDILETVVMPKLAHHYGIGYANGLAAHVVEAAEKARTIASHRPDNAITLLDKVSASVTLQRSYNIMTCPDPTVQQHMKSAPVVVNSTHVDNYHKEQGFAMPASFQAVKNRIFFRDAAVDAMYAALDDYVRFDAMFPTGKPFRLNVSGDAKSGRTTMVRAAAELIDEQPVYLDLTDYTDAPSLNRIIGSPMGYVGYDSKQEMPFDIIESNPRKVVILDGLDRCHPVVKDFFESAMATGLIKYADNRTVDASKCIVICVTEAKSRKGSIGFAKKADPTSITEVDLKALSRDEMEAGAQRMFDDMVASLKRDHQKYASLPDSIPLPDDERNGISSPEDMAAAARRAVLAYI